MEHGAVEEQEVLQQIRSALRLCFRILRPSISAQDYLVTTNRRFLGHLLSQMQYPKTFPVFISEARKRLWNMDAGKRDLRSRVNDTISM